ncbi:hypothetical protein GDO81_002072 [Engystomops pustulosus]|uniref:Uncharacterized protein n=1 Tax=Engystomops pustulosus TaxID=76066 RepID=A0AAV7DH88_ENGPU|nr:hypothetical protein GDO81_002072 [Engystomops pustulosus]
MICFTLATKRPFQKRELLHLDKYISRRVGQFNVYEPADSSDLKVTSIIFTDGLHIYASRLSEYLLQTLKLVISFNKNMFKARH